MDEINIQQPKVTVIILVTKTDEGIDKTIKSLVNQSVNFKANIEIIVLYQEGLDQSHDSLYKTHAHNLRVQTVESDQKYIMQQLRLASDHIHGEFVLSIHPGSIVSVNNLKQLVKQALAYPEIDIFTTRDNVFSRSIEVEVASVYDRSVIDVAKTPQIAPKSVNNSFVRVETLKSFLGGNLIDYPASEVAFLNQAVASKAGFGLLSSSTIDITNARRATAGVLKDNSWYFDTPNQVYSALLKSQKDKSDYTSYTLMNELQQRYKQARQVVLTKREESDYKKTLQQLTQKVDDKLILGARYIATEYRLFILSQKHGKNVFRYAKRNGSKYYFKDSLLYDSSEKPRSVHIELVSVLNDEVCIEGYCNGLFFNDEHLVFDSGSNDYQAKRVKRQHQIRRSLGDEVLDRYCFKATIPIHDAGKITAKLKQSDDEKVGIPVAYRPITMLNTNSKWSYRRDDDYLMSATAEGLQYSLYSSQLLAWYELKYYGYLLRRLKLSIVKPPVMRAYQTMKADLHHRPFSAVALNFVKEMRWLLVVPKSIVMNLYAVLLRLIYWTVKPFVSRRIWIVSDRASGGGDNGEAFFRYLMDNPVENTSIYFALEKSSQDYERLKTVGPVLALNSFKYKLYFLLSSKIISSQASDYVTNPFGERRQDFTNLFGYHFVFLQHGIIYNDLSSFLNRYKKNIDLFVTSVVPEYKSILEFEYGYDEGVVKLTGLPRYDLLKSKPKSKLIIAPTWRKNLAGKMNLTTATRKHNPEFIDSEYYTFYQSLINDNRIVTALKEHNMTAEFYLHLSLEKQVKDFHGNEVAKIMHLPHDYPKAFNEGSILVTDYSSIAFDFAYLKKPIIYTQFDRNRFYEGQNYDPGYFDFDDDGFGPVAYDYESAVKEIVESIKRNCTMEKKYLQRIEKFFYKVDDKNSKRVLDEIVKLDDK